MFIYFSVTLEYVRYVSEKENKRNQKKTKEKTKENKTHTYRTILSMYGTLLL